MLLMHLDVQRVQWSEAEDSEISKKSDNEAPESW